MGAGTGLMTGLLTRILEGPEAEVWTVEQLPITGSTEPTLTRC
jgi:hypothetical protein